MKSAISKSVIVTSVVSATILCFAVGTGTAFAQAAPVPAASTVAATPSAAAATPPTEAKTALAEGKAAKPKLSPDEKKKISQECSAQANDKKLHGKERRTFRANCIRHGGTSA